MLIKVIMVVYIELTDKTAKTSTVVTSAVTHPTPQQHLLQTEARKETMLHIFIVHGILNLG